MLIKSEGRTFRVTNARTIAVRGGTTDHIPILSMHESILAFVGTDYNLSLHLFVFNDDFKKKIPINKQKVYNN
jgi:hypothetical protein